MTFPKLSFTLRFFGEWAVGGDFYDPRCLPTLRFWYFHHHLGTRLLEPRANNADEGKNSRARCFVIQDLIKKK